MLIIVAAILIEIIIASKYILKDITGREFLFYTGLLSVCIMLIYGFYNYNVETHDPFVYWIRLIGLSFTSFALIRTLFVQSTIKDQLFSQQKSFVQTNIRLVSKVVSKTDIELKNLKFQRAWDVSDALQFFIEDCCVNVKTNPKLSEVMISLQKDYRLFRAELGRIKDDKNLYNFEQAFKISKKLSQIQIRLNSSYGIKN